MRHLQLLGGLVLALTIGADRAWADLQSAAEEGDLEAVLRLYDRERGSFSSLCGPARRVAARRAKAPKEEPVRASGAPI